MFYEIRQGYNRKIYLVKALSIREKSYPVGNGTHRNLIVQGVILTRTGTGYRRLVQTWKHFTNPVMKEISEDVFEKARNKQVFKEGEYAKFRGKPFKIEDIEQYVLHNGEFIPVFKLLRSSRDEYDNYLIKQL